MRMAERAEQRAAKRRQAGTVGTSVGVMAVATIAATALLGPAHSTTVTPEDMATGEMDSAAINGRVDDAASRSHERDALFAVDNAQQVSTAGDTATATTGDSTNAQTTDAITAAAASLTRADQVTAESTDVSKADLAAIKDAQDTLAQLTALAQQDNVAPATTTTVGADGAVTAGSDATGSDATGTDGASTDAGIGSDGTGSASTAGDGTSTDGTGTDGSGISEASTATDGSGDAASADATASPEANAGSAVSTPEDETAPVDAPATTDDLSNLTSDQLTAKIAEATQALDALLDAASSTGVAAEAAPLSAAEKLAEIKAEAKADAPELYQKYGTLKYGNGQLPGADKCGLSFASGSIRCDAAAQLERMNQAYKLKFGKNIQVTDTYRTYGQQLAVKAAKGYLAATPGTSNHGNGIAIDLGGGIQSSGSAQHQWMVAHAADFGFENPDWARTTKIEPWHWEYNPGGTGLL
jgi:LAS superfamily LD-carboxypeptidase LdcB